MDNLNEATREEPKRSSLKDQLESVPWTVLVALTTGFVAGAGGFNWGLDAFNQDIVAKDTYVLKQDLAGSLLRREAVVAIDLLIQNGQDLDGDAPKSRTWLMQVLAFIHGLNLEKDFNWEGNHVSAVEADIRYALTDESLDIQVQKVLGIMRGLRSAFQARIQSN
jgi:hypothetical protein